jgi:prepilin-type N-terminal cleavage/methylation domain-containing protein
MASTKRSGYSLIEMLVATAILLVAIGVLAELADVGLKHASRAEEAAAAQRICQNLLDEILCGVIPLESTAEDAVSDEPDWTYSIDVKPIERVQWEPGLAELRVTVVKTPEGVKAGKPFSLIRWVRYSSPEKRPGQDTNSPSAPPKQRPVLKGPRP